MDRTVEEYIAELREMQRRSRLPADAPETITAADGITGNLIVIVTHSRGTFPVSNAKITVLGDGDEVTTVYTDISGRSPKITLPTVSRDFSETPETNGNAVAKYYDIQIDSDNFVSVLIKNIPIFEGVTSLQGYDMVYRGSVNDQQMQIIELPTNNV